MPSEYISPDEYALFGLKPDTTPNQVQQVSTLVDSMLYLKKGLAWAPDADGLPCYMAGAVPAMAWTINGAITAGENVLVTLNGKAPSTLVGQPILFDRTTTGAVEACVVTAVAGLTITLDVVTKNHASGVKIEAGMFLEHTGKATGLRACLFVQHKPVAGIISARYRYAGAPRGLASDFEDGRGLGWGSSEGVAPVLLATSGWTEIDVSQIEFEAEISQVFVPCGLYCDVKLHYVAGYSSANIPMAIKMACAQLMLAANGDANRDQIIKDIQEAFAIRRVGI